MNLDFEKYLGKKVALAVSGGADSMALLELARDAALDAVILHVNHRLRPTADAEAEYVRGLGGIILDWRGEKPATGLENAAREARYKLMTDYCRANGIPVLMTAHQADDNIETFLMNLSRGSGIYGLGGIRPESVRDGITIARPLLKIFRRQLCEILRARKVKYFNDEMNEDEKYLRVRMRKGFNGLGISDARMLLSIENLARARDALENHIDGSEEIQLKLLSSLIQKTGGGKYPPRLKSVREILSNTKARMTLGNCVITIQKEKK